MGKEQVKDVTLKLKPDRYINKGMGNVSSSFLGMPLTHDDEVVNKLIWGKPKTLNEDGRLFLRDEFKSSTHIVNLMMDFTHRRYTVSYVQLGDVLSKIGGLRSFFVLLPGLYIPLIMLNFLVRLATIIKE